MNYSGEHNWSWWPNKHWATSMQHHLRHWFWHWTRVSWRSHSNWFTQVYWAFYEQKCCRTIWWVFSIDNPQDWLFFHKDKELKCFLSMHNPVDTVSRRLHSEENIPCNWNTVNSSLKLQHWFVLHCVLTLTRLHMQWIMILIPFQGECGSQGHSSCWMWSRWVRWLFFPGGRWSSAGWERHRGESLRAVVNWEKKSRNNKKHVTVTSAGHSSNFSIGFPPVVQPFFCWLRSCFTFSELRCARDAQRTLDLNSRMRKCACFTSPHSTFHFTSSRSSMTFRNGAMHQLGTVTLINSFCFFPGFAHLWWESSLFHLFQFWVKHLLFAMFRSQVLFQFHIHQMFWGMVHEDQKAPVHLYFFDILFEKVCFQKPQVYETRNSDQRIPHSKWQYQAPSSWFTNHGKQLGPMCTQDLFSLQTVCKQVVLLKLMLSTLRQTRKVNFLRSEEFWSWPQPHWFSWCNFIQPFSLLSLETSVLESTLKTRCFQTIWRRPTFLTKPPNIGLITLTVSCHKHYSMVLKQIQWQAPCSFQFWKVCPSCPKYFSARRTIGWLQSILQNIWSKTWWEESLPWLSNKHFARGSSGSPTMRYPNTISWN